MNAQAETDADFIKLLVVDPPPLREEQVERLRQLIGPQAPVVALPSVPQRRASRRPAA